LATSIKAEESSAVLYHFIIIIVRKFVL